MMCYRVLCLAFVCSLLAACGTSTRGLVDVGLPDRCADVMESAFPGSDIEVTDQHALAVMTTAKVELRGVRKDVAPGTPTRRDIAVECQFDHEVLTSFRWTAGPL
ncbi:MAG TPA: hypothetical protein VNT30_05950 [Stellaceae bacterium]|nr:hypothetical protein [Stellaceae bacterium]